MELWLCKRNEFGLLKDERKISFFRVNNPHQPIETLEYMGGKTRTTARAFIDDLVTKHGMLKAKIDGAELPDLKGFFEVIDFNHVHGIRLLALSSGYKYLTFLAYTNLQPTGEEKPAFVQFFVQKHRGRNFVRCRAREAFQPLTLINSVPGFLIFEH